MFECFLTRILQRKALRKAVHPHNGVYIPLESACRIGFVANAENTGSAQAVRTIMQEMHKRKIDCRGIFLDFRKNPEEDGFSDKIPSLNILHRDSVNWYGLPSESSVNAFTAHHFDILIDLTQGKRIFAADYILAKADASFRIGVSTGTENIYDMTVFPPEGQQTSNPDQLAKSIITYLTTIQTDPK